MIGEKIGFDTYLDIQIGFDFEYSENILEEARDWCRETRVIMRTGKSRRPFLVTRLSAEFAGL